jgi:hypothetical protein
VVAYVLVNAVVSFFLVDKDKTREGATPPHYLLYTLFAIGSIRLPGTVSTVVSIATWRRVEGSQAVTSFKHTHDAATSCRH